ncbi:DUF262 domain-containing protein [Polaribacter sp. 20A6]|uniref:DUF262 domain-containing protein n=1 Tax=Polaribacter sp. 20A6 TaxID=2687289 RepID=UPI0013FE00DC|nr:DUF262 domain-containing protein [Polaribacter sp. 20A6]
MVNLKDKKLEESIPSNGIKIIELYNKVDSGLLNTRPNYQRKLVWKKQHKFAFIDTILHNYPFPEIYIASADIDVEKMVAKEVIVDGQQRLTTIVEYIKGEGDFLNQKKLTAFRDLLSNEKKDFLNYKVSIKDLKDIGDNLVKEIFQRINSTEYSLNTVEKNNARFGDGEIALFCKQLIDSEYIASENETDIIIENEIKNEINNFFSEKNIFTQNDIKRMYDFQYLMLITATILEGNYFGRSSKIDEYLDKFNSEFSENKIVLNLLLDSLRVILKLNFSDKSYWFNKANLFTLIIEISKTDKTKLDISKLELELLNLEDKVDIYFSADAEEDLKGITEEERKYFEMARHGSHEKSSREHRAIVISNLIKKSTISDQLEDSNIIFQNIKYFKEQKLNFSIIIPTETGLNKGILDAVSEVRNFLAIEKIHDFKSQELGPDHKVKKKCLFNKGESNVESEVSLYRSNGRGDYRIWFSSLNEFAEANDKLALINEKGIINVLNFSKIDYTTEFN